MDGRVGEGYEMMEGMVSRRVWGFSAVAAALVLAGCTAGTTGPDATATRSETPTPTPSAPCIVGSWETDAAQLQSAYDEIPLGLDYPAATIDPASAATIAFTAGGDFSFGQDVMATLTWLSRPAAVRLGGTMTGSYTATGDALSLAVGDNALTVTPADDARASGLFTAATQETLMEWPVTARSFACDGDQLVLDLETEGHQAAVAFIRR